jgi:hypothetical protein
MPQQEYFTVREAAEFLRMSEFAFRTFLSRHSERLMVVRHGRRVLTGRRSFEAQLRGQVAR